MSHTNTSTLSPASDVSFSSIPQSTEVRFTNHSPNVFKGWIRRNIDFVPPHSSGEIDGVTYMVGMATGEDTHACHFQIRLEPGERKKVSLSQATPKVIPPMAPVGLSWFGGPMELNGQTLQVIDIGIDGPSYTAHLRTRMGSMVHEVWAWQYPGQPWIEGGILSVNSDPTTEDMVCESPALRLQFGNGLTFVPGRDLLTTVSDSKQVADGQGFALPFTILWPSHIDEPEDTGSFQAIANGQIGAVGIQSLLFDGNPIYSESFNPIQWARNQWNSATDALHDWRAPILGIAPRSTNTGAQEDQIFSGGEAMLPNGVGAEYVNYLAALKWAQRPCHYYEEDGSPIDVRNHPELVIWEGRPHRIGNDMLGKTEQIGEASGWYGPDRQHWLVSRLASANRIYGDPITDRLLEHQAQLFLASETIDPRLSTSHSGSARSVGYAPMLALALWRGLRNRNLADRVKQRIVDRIELIYIPELSDRPGGLWDVRADDRILVDLDRAVKDQTWAEAVQFLHPYPNTSPIVAQIEGRRGTVAHLAQQLKVMGYTVEAELLTPLIEYLSENSYAAGAMLWQQSLGAYGLYLTSRAFNIPAGVELAVDAASAVVEHGWRKINNQWMFWENVGWMGGSTIPDSEYVEGKGAHRTGWFDSTWASPGVWVIRHHTPQDTKVAEIWDTIASNGGSWIPPGVSA